MNSAVRILIICNKTTFAVIFWKIICKYLISNWSLTNNFVCRRIRFNTRFLDSHVKITTKNILREEKYFCMHDWYWIIHKAKNIPGIISYIFQLIFLLLLLLTFELVTINLRLTITYCYFFLRVHIFITNVITWLYYFNLRW